MSVVKVTPIISDNGACVKVNDSNHPSSVVFDCGLSDFDEPVLPIHLSCGPEYVADDEVTTFHRLEPYFDEGESVQACVTHAHYDHANALRALNALQIVKGIDLRIWMTNFGVEFVRSMIMNFEDGPREIMELTPFRTNDPLDPDLTDGMIIQPFLVCHSTPQTHFYLLWTSKGWIVYLADWTAQRFSLKQAEMTWRLFRQIGKLKPKAVIMGSISSRESSEGLTPLETTITPGLRRTFADSMERGRRTIITHFGSNVDRTAMELDLAEKMDMVTYLKGAPWNFLSVSEASGNRLKYPVNMQRLRDSAYASSVDLLITSGSQAEYDAHLTRAAYDRHLHMEVNENDTIVFSARPIPGNEIRIKEMMQKLLDKGAELVLPIELKGDPIFRFDQEGLVRYEVTHVSGHEGWLGSRKALELLQPEIVIPFHGPNNLRCELRDHIEQDLPEITVLMPREGETITID